MADVPALRVLVTDDHPLFREGLCGALAGAEGIEVVGQAESAAQARERLAAEAVDVLVLDLRLPDEHGIELTRAVVRAHPDTRVLVMTMSENDDDVLAAVRAGARGYLVKGASRDEVIHAVRVAGSGGAVFGGAVADRLSAFLGAVAAAPARQAFPTLTERERDVLDLVARGYANRRISQELVLSEKTVRNYVSTVFAKLGVTDRAAAVVRARNAGFGLTPE
jgi:DNA-binding NarL/FixJ family response regulator